MPGATIGDCLAAVGVGARHLNGCTTAEQEWPIIKRAYFKKVLSTHPDKGGDAAAFRDVQAAFEVLRRLFDTGAVECFRLSQDQPTTSSFEGSKADFKDTATPSWEYYAEAAKEEVATYRVELAKSGRSRCQARGTKKKCDQDPPFIEKGDLRVGFITESGGYGMFCHLCCWRVPSKIWLGLPDPVRCRTRRKFEQALLRMNQVALTGVEELPRSDRAKIVRHVMDKAHWTFDGDVEKLRKKPAATAAGGPEEEEDASPSPVDGGAQLATTSSELVTLPLKRQFSIPAPGRDGPAGCLSGQTFVVTGVFPEVGGGQGLELGKAKVKKMIESFGGKVTSAVSGKTDVLVVGKDPGFSKVSKARKSPATRLVGLHDLKVGIEHGSLDDAKAKPLLIRSFSKGFSQRRGGPNGLALKASKEELAIASGTKAPALTSRSAGKARSTVGRTASTRTPRSKHIALKRPASVAGSVRKTRRV